MQHLRITTDKIFVIDHYDAGNLLSLNTAIELDFIQIKDERETSNTINNMMIKEQSNENTTDDERKANEIKRTIVEEFPDVFDDFLSIIDFNLYLIHRLISIIYRL